MASSTAPWLTTRNERGSLETELKVIDTIRPGTIVLEGKWWCAPPETAAVANRLAPDSWSEVGQPAYNDTFVDVLPAP